MHSIQSYIKEQIDTDFNINDELPFEISEVELPKNTIITHYHQVEKYAYFLQEGIAKISLIKENEERILEFFFPNTFFSSYTSFLTQKPSDVEIMLLTDCNLQRIYVDDINKAYQHSLLANQLGRIVTSHYYIQKTNREKDFLTKTATERYQDLIDNRAELIKEIPVNMLVKYLGIKPESLSRIRKEMM